MFVDVDDPMCLVILARGTIIRGPAEPEDIEAKMATVVEERSQGRVM